MSKLKLQLIILKPLGPISALQAETCVPQRMLGDFNDAPGTDVFSLDSHDQVFSTLLQREPGSAFHSEVDLMSSGSDDNDRLRI